MNIRTAGFRIDSQSPAYLRHLGCRDEFAVPAIDYVEVTILVRLHEGFANAIANPKVGKKKVLNRVVVPLIAGGALIVPLQLSGICVDGDDRGDVEIVHRLCLPAAIPNVR
jgi:hypothetical protein